MYAVICRECDFRCEYQYRDSAEVVQQGHIHALGHETVIETGGDA